MYFTIFNPFRYLFLNYINIYYATNNKKNLPLYKKIYKKFKFYAKKIIYYANFVL